MDRIRIKGGRQLKGDIPISGSKNACLPLMVASLLTDQKLVLHNVPRLADITTLMQLLKHHGVEVNAAPGENGHSHGTTLTLQARKITSTTAPYDIVRKMRASVLVLGAVLAREGEARVSLPGGCAIGARRCRARSYPWPRPPPSSGSRSPRPTPWGRCNARPSGPWAPGRPGSRHRYRSWPPWP